ncbi:brachyurin-like [Neocloeon triangulifer]|uniref:brachyurin-like n=1 Tax=Neocloeon triangulifer TaxID=2078957 RepID=UPI00286F8930|nr:brachyurin-like [Neocloeon triangulifer]
MHLFAVFIALLCMSVNCQAFRDEPEYVDYSEITDLENAYTLDKLINGTDENFISSSNGTDHETFPKWPVNNTNSNNTNEGRILGGTAATLGQFPYFVYVLGTKADGTTTISCGGALLSESWVLTAAQCVAQAASILVYAGAIAPPATGDTTGKAGQAIIHPYYRSNFVIHDVALVRLFIAFTLSGTISPIRLSKNSASIDNVSVRTMGMGTADDTTGAGTALNYVDLKNIPRATCNIATDTAYVTYPPTAGCLDPEGTTKNFCLGDRGAPVVYNFDTGLVVIGITSQLQGCVSNAYPSSYTKILPYLGWIREKTKKNFT